MTTIKKEYDIKYAEMTGTYYRKQTPLKVREILESSKRTRTRLKIHLGDVKTGEPWGDIETGHVGRSTGDIKIPLVINNSRSLGGGALLDDCIVKIEYANKKNGGVIYNV